MVRTISEKLVEQANPVLFENQVLIVEINFIEFCHSNLSGSPINSRKSRIFFCFHKRDARYVLSCAIKNSLDFIEKGENES